MEIEDTLFLDGRAIYQKKEKWIIYFKKRKKKVGCLENERETRKKEPKLFELSMKRVFE